MVKAVVAHRARTPLKALDWIIPAAAMKCKEERLVPVGGALAQLFGDRSGYLFSDDGGETPVGGLGKNVTFKRDMGHGAASQDAVAKVGEERGLNWPQEYWCLHDLRCIDASASD